MSDFTFPPMPGTGDAGEGRKAPRAAPRKRPVALVRRAGGAIRRPGPRTATMLLGSRSPQPYDMFRAAAVKKGLVISGRFPGHLRGRYGLTGAELLWLSDYPSRKEQSLGPAELEHRILGKALRHLKGSGGALLLEDLEYISAQRGFHTLGRFVKCLSDAAMEGSGCFLATVDPDALSKRELGVLGKSFDLVLPLEAEGTGGARAPGLLLPSSSYLLEGGGPQAYRFVTSKAAGRAVLGVTTVPPLKLRERYGFQGTELLWLTEAGRGRGTLRPEKLGFEVQRAVLRHLGTGKMPVVFLDGLEQLGLYVDFPELLRFVKLIIDAAAERGGAVIASMGPGSLERAEEAMVRKRFDFEVTIPSR